MPAWTWAAHRAGAYAVTTAALVLLNVTLPRLMPGDPLTAMVTPGAHGYVTDAVQRENLRAFYGLDRPWTAHLGDHLLGLAHGDLGHSLATQLPVGALIAERLPRTLLLVACALVVGTAVSGALGAVAGWHAGGRRDAGIVVGVALLRSVPVFFVAALLHHIFAVRLRWLPVFGAHTRFAEAGWDDAARHLVLPAAALALAFVGGQTLVMRAQVAAEKAQPYVQTARARGVDRRSIRWRHVTRNAWRPVVAVIGVQAGVALSGTVLVESVFAYPGVGSLLMEAIAGRDYPLIQGCFLAHTAMVLGCGALADAARAVLDPRSVTA